MSKHEEADLILKLYELRREETMRKARDWFFPEFHPESIDDVNNAMFSEHSGHLRMVPGYWDMAAALVNHGAISSELFLAVNNDEHINVFAKVEPPLGQLRSLFFPQLLAHLEKLIDDTPGLRDQLPQRRERAKNVHALFLAHSPEALEHAA
jgi:hypothetical protein